MEELDHIYVPYFTCPIFGCYTYYVCYCAVLITVVYYFWQMTFQNSFLINKNLYKYLYFSKNKTCLVSAVTWLLMCIIFLFADNVWKSIMTFRHMNCRGRNGWATKKIKYGYSYFISYQIWQLKSCFEHSVNWQCILHKQFTLVQIWKPTNFNNVNHKTVLL